MGVVYNIGARYEIVGRMLDGTHVMAYLIKDRLSQNEIRLEKGIVEQLALNKQIYNCNAQVYNNAVNLKGINCKISQLPKYDDDGNIIPKEPPKLKIIPNLKLVGKVQSGRTISDYIVVSLSDESTLMKIPKDAVLLLAQEGRITNAKVQYNNGKLMLRGKDGRSLAKLALYR